MPSYSASTIQINNKNTRASVYIPLSKKKKSNRTHASRHHCNIQTGIHEETHRWWCSTYHRDAWRLRVPRNVGKCWLYALEEVEEVLKQLESNVHTWRLWCSNNHRGGSGILWPVDLALFVRCSRIKWWDQCFEPIPYIHLLTHGYIDKDAVHSEN